MCGIPLLSGKLTQPDVNMGHQMDMKIKIHLVGYSFLSILFSDDALVYCVDLDLIFDYADLF